MSADDRTVDLLWLIVALVLVASALAARRISLGLLVRSVLGWAAIVIVAVLAVTHRYEIGAMFARVSSGFGLDEQQTDGKAVRIRMSPDGHFWANVRLNGFEKRMMVDSGATLTAISQTTAESANATPDAAGFPVLIDTANGTIAAKRATIGTLAVGPLETRDLGVVVSPNFGDLDVLGMNFLSRLKSWRVEGNMLVLEPKGAPVAGGEAGNGE